MTAIGQGRIGLEMHVGAGDLRLGGAELGSRRGALSPEKIIIDTDIGDDVDDPFALALAVRSPELQILGVMTTFGDTETRAK